MPVRISDLEDEVLVKAAARLSRGRRRKRIKKSKHEALKRAVKRTALDTSVRLKRFAEREAKLDTLHPPVHASRATKIEVEESVMQTLPATSGVNGGSFGLERKLGGLNNLLSVEYLEAGREAARAVIRISTPLGVGSGFMVSPNIVVTNHHVISTLKVGQHASFDLFAEETTINPNFPASTQFFDPSKFFFTDEDLDITFIAVEQESACHECGWLPMFAETGKILIGHPVNVIQHPDGDEKKIAVQDSLLLDLEEGTADTNFCWYSADTEEGSSGSPVLNNRWEVIAVHHKSVPDTNVNGDILDINGKVMSKQRLESNPDMVKWVANEGIRTSKIVAALNSAKFSDAKHAALRDRVVNLWQHPRAFRPGLKQGWF